AVCARARLVPTASRTGPRPASIAAAARARRVRRVRLATSTATVRATYAWAARARTRLASTRSRTATRPASIAAAALVLCVRPVRDVWATATARAGIAWGTYAKQAYPMARCARRRTNVRTATVLMVFAATSPAAGPVRRVTSRDPSGRAGTSPPDKTPPTNA